MVTDTSWPQRWEWFQSIMICPVKIGDEQVAVLGVDCRKIGVYDRACESLLRYAADSLAILFQLCGNGFGEGLHGLKEFVE